MTFGELYMSKREFLSWRAPIVGKAIIDVLHPKSVVDVGCSIGEFVAYFQRAGLLSAGIDNSPEAKAHFKGDKAYFFLQDLSQPNIVGQTFDLAMCFEVISIMPRSEWPSLIDNLCWLSKQLLLGIHEHSVLYVDRLLTDRGYVRDFTVVEKIREHLETWKRKSAMKAIYYSMTFYRREEEV
jgi:SAM-dependent methyltransferase